MNVLHTQGAGIPRAWTDDSHAEWDREARSYGPDGDGDGDGETDDSPTPLTTVVPWDPDGGDDDRRRFEGEHLLFLTGAEWQAVDYLLAYRIPLTGIGSRCVWTPTELDECQPRSDWKLKDTAGSASLNGQLFSFRPSPVLGGTFLIFPGE